MVNLDDESEFELVEKPDVTSNQERYAVQRKFIFFMISFSLLPMLVVQLDSCLECLWQQFWLFSISLLLKSFFCCTLFSLHSSDNLDVSAMEMVCNSF